MDRPSALAIVYWRPKGHINWLFGYVTYCSGGLIRMGSYYGDNMGGYVVDPSEIEWRSYAS